MVRQAVGQDLNTVAALAAELWPKHTAAELEAEFAQVMEQGGAFFLALEGQTPVGFAQCQLRHDYVEGAEHSPVGYLEGIYVREVHRGKGLARKLLQACEKWALEQGCLEFASDCELGNDASLAFHLGTGFAEINRIICFVKPLERGTINCSSI